MQDTYYLRSEVSNSDLTELKNLLYPRTQYGDKEKAFKFGSLVDAMLTEPERVRYDKHTVDDVLYSGEDWELAQAMIKSLRMEARHDPLLAQVLAKAETQRFMVNKGQRFQYGNFEYTLDTRCKWDWWLPTFGFGGDLKTTFASSQKQFDEAIDFLIGIVPVPGIWYRRKPSRFHLWYLQEEPKSVQGFHQTERSELPEREREIRGTSLPVVDANKLIV